MSANPCGCDPEAGRTCADHKLDVFREKVLEAIELEMLDWDHAGSATDALYEVRKKIERLEY